jgi:phenylacetaldehyde dehydrogenase
MTSLRSNNAQLSVDSAKTFIDRGQQKIFINGEWVDSYDGSIFETVDPGTGNIINEIAKGSICEINDAVIAARKALESDQWFNMLPVGRAEILNKIANIMEDNIDELSELETLDQGKPLYVSRWAEIPGAIDQFRYFSGVARTIEGQTITSSIGYQPQDKKTFSYTKRHPIGVVACITPWNSPLVLTAMKLAPALAAGCTIVLKPATYTSLTAVRLVEICQQAGLPDGVINLVTGSGSTIGHALPMHPDVDKVSFTGSTEIGRRVIQAAGESNLKKVQVELGGKSPQIVMPDADLNLTIPGVANAIFFNGGQVCVAGSRLIVHKSISDQLIEGVAKYGREMVMGHGLDPKTQMGPLVAKSHAESVKKYVDDALIDGAVLISGGQLLGTSGCFMEPTIVGSVNRDMAIFKEEVFGPVLTVSVFEDIEQAVALANDSNYGLAASLWTEGLSNTHRIADSINAGTVWVNSHLMFDSALPIGGWKQSGWGKESGHQAVSNYLKDKTVTAIL